MKYPTQTTLIYYKASNGAYGNSFKKVKKEVEEWLDTYPKFAPVLIERVIKVQQPVASIGSVASTIYDEDLK